jgi:hypothetical protein
MNFGNKFIISIENVAKQSVNESRLIQRLAGPGSFFIGLTFTAAALRYVLRDAWPGGEGGRAAEDSAAV